MAYKNDGPVVAGRGALYTINGQTGRESDVPSLREANFIESECGCGVDCCNNRLVLLDQTLGTKVFIQVINDVFTVTNAAGEVIFPTEG